MKTTLRQVIFAAVAVSFKQDALTQKELHELTEYILNNSTLELSADKICLSEGNYFGVGEHNKDKDFMLPKFITFELSKPSSFEIINFNKGKTWELKSHETFEDLENHLTYPTQNCTVVFIDGIQIDYELVTTESWGHEVRWSTFDDVYIVTYTINNTEKKEKLNSKIELQKKILDIVNQGANRIQAYNNFTKETIPFKVQGVLYSSNKSDCDHKYLIWDTNIENECEEPF